MARPVLLAGDDPFVRSVIQDALRREGFLVFPACNGEKALEILDQLATVQLLVTDIHMGKGISGLALAERVMEKRPGTPVLVISAYFEGAPVAFGKLLPYLAKPSSAESLVSRAREVLADRSAVLLDGLNGANLTAVTPR